jgi:hypothetical protein
MFKFGISLIGTYLELGTWSLGFYFIQNKKPS